MPTYGATAAHTATLPVSEPAGRVPAQSTTVTGAGVASPPVTDAPLKVADVPSVEVSVMTDRNSRRCVEAATVVTQGERCATVPAPGPENGQRAPLSARASSSSTDHWS
ncbi:hypothetical protein GCM10027610_018630 [Dactylosporangium cerinum]